VTYAPIFRLIHAVFKTLGWRGLCRRTLHEIRCRVSAFKAKPTLRLVSAPAKPTLDYAPACDLSGLAADVRDEAIRRAQRVTVGYYEAYGHDWRQLPKTELEWRTQPYTGYEFLDREWWKIPQLPRGHDIKDVWEPGRFSWVYDLIRGYLLTRSPVYVAAFDQYVTNWIESNPPYKGPHWSCGQEIAIRCIAILHALDSLAWPSQSEATARLRLLNLLAISAERIADGIGYGLSQRNNHGISEACALIHIGIRLGDVPPKARAWLRRGLRLLEEQIHDQFLPDGWYSQHSFTYLRVALEQILLVQRVVSRHGATLSPSALELVTQAAQLLSQVICEANGHVPNHGANDGGRVIHLSTAEYGDFRPILTMASLILDMPLPADIPTDAETSAWIATQSSRRAPVRVDEVVVGKQSGWVVARLRGAQVFLRAGSNRHRPSHMDLLHLHVRFDHSDVIVDAGTYRYNGTGIWKNALVAASVHNGPVLDDQEPAVKGPRFLWYSWPSACVTSASLLENCITICAEAQAKVRREISIQGDDISIVDTVLDPKILSMSVTWLLNPALASGDFVVTGVSERIAATEDSPIGWHSPSYALRYPSAAIKITQNRVSDILRIRTIVRNPLAASRAAHANE